MIYLPKSNTLFINVPKNASTSFSTLLRDTATIFSDKHLTLYEIENIITLPSSVNIVAIIREPFERLLSLYLYRIKQQRYNTRFPSPEDFRKRVKEGNGTLIDHPWQMRAQSDYMPKERGTWWSYKNIDKLANNISTNNLQWENKSTSIPYSILIPKFYDADTYELVKQKYQCDIYLYEEINEC
jgi:hypothetical protein